MVVDEGSAGLPGHPALAAAATALEDGGFAGEIWDAGWRLAYLSSEYRSLISGGRGRAEIQGLGMHVLSPEFTALRENWPAGPTFDSWCASLKQWGGAIVAATPGGLDALRQSADSRLASILDGVEPAPAQAAWSAEVDIRFGTDTIANDVLLVTVRDDSGATAGYVGLVKPAVRAAVLGMLALGDVRLFERMSGLLEPTRRPGAVLFADLENSTPLAKRLSTPAYFNLIRRLAAGSDRAVVSGGGIVGKHVGDGVTAFFLVEDGRSESAVARACIEAMRRIREAAITVAQRSGLAQGDVTLRFGLHWGATLYVGRLMTSGRAEVTALGEEVNDAARIEACAGGGRALASKALVERLDTEDAKAVGLDPLRLSYASLASLPTATEKARRDAPALAVCEL